MKQKHIIKDKFFYKYIGELSEFTHQLNFSFMRNCFSSPLFLSPQSSVLKPGMAAVKIHLLGVFLVEDR